MKSDYTVMLDACVLLPMPLADTLLRMAETPRLFLPKWSSETIKEVSRNLIGKWNKTPEQAANRELAMRAHFPEALVEEYEALVPAMQNEAKDRHVLAAAIKCGAKLIVSYNSKHFPREALLPYDIEVQGPSTFLSGLYDLEPGIVSVKLTEQAQNIGCTLEQFLHKLVINVPSFVNFFCEEQKIDLS